MDINKLLELNQLARDDAARYARKRAYHYNRVHASLGKHFTGIVGPRGSGKTIILKQLSRELKNSFYLSVDTLEDVNLFDTAKLLTERYKVTCLLLDEIHFQKNFEGELKKMFDFLNVRIVFTSSVALAMIESTYDLSRRIQLERIFPFSFSEYLLFRNNAVLASLTLDDIIHRRWTGEHLSYGYAFEDYLKGGLHPFSLEETNVLSLLKNVLHTVIRRDIPSIAKLLTDEVSTIERVVEFIGRAEVDGINYSSVSRNIGITKYKAERYIDLLTKSFILNPVFPHGTNVLKEPKVLMYLPYRLLYRPYDQAIGALREDFFAESMAMVDRTFSYLKSTRGKKTPDFLLRREDEDLVLEVGGKGKGKRQFKDLTATNKIRFVHSAESDGNKRPLFMLGYLAPSQ